MTKRAWRLVAGGYVVLAIAFGVTIAIVVAEVHRLDDTQRTIKAAQAQNIKNAEQLRTTQGALGAFTVKITGAVCLLALEPTSAGKRALVESYASGAPITLDGLGPTCRYAAERAIDDVFDSSPPPEVKALK